MLDTTELTVAVERFADRLRAAPQSRLQRGAAAQGLALARELSLRAQRIEAPDAPPRTMPDAGIFAVADQLVVACNDLAEVLRTAPAGSPLQGELLRRELDEAVAAVRRAAATATL
ncbi:hypothetical protein QWM81_03565 [Streptomyces ficellus]|uniref:Uncharacterized protein n=1 Tax=Streptomyces ficellus TaxID=1977088 RepID=A0ABT7Z0X8_9ACTN|nr:hypothetical protein [Streptomyces ficellus]MDN3293139.1 hypothetical protein [Streptomyces ficellus]